MIKRVTVPGLSSHTGTTDKALTGFTESVRHYAGQFQELSTGIRMERPSISSQKGRYGVATPQITRTVHQAAQELGTGIDI